MTGALGITFICDPSESMSYEDFVAAVARHAGAPVVLIRARLADAEVGEGFVLLATLYDLHTTLESFPPERRASLVKRLVVFSRGPADALELAERTGVAAAIDRLSLLEWQSDPASTLARGPTGLRSVAAAMGVECADRFGGERYCLLQSTAHEGLPHLLVDYLRTYEER